MPKELVIKSFKNCALDIALDGSEDDLIHCFKPNGPIPGGRTLLEQARIDENAERMAQLMEEIDFAEDEHNGYEGDGSVDFETQ